MLVNKSRSLVVALGVLALGGCAVSPAEDPVQIRMNDIDTRLQRIERVLTNQSLLELAQRIDALQADVRSIRGEVELLQNQTEGGKTFIIYHSAGPDRQLNTQDDIIKRDQLPI